MAATEVMPEGGSFVGDEPGSSSEPAGACAVQRLPLRVTQSPIDIILVLDNSVSMARELEAVERSINRSFATILEASRADYRVILLSRHRNADRDATDAARTAICVAAPLSSLPECPASVPGNSERFFHYPVDIDSGDSLSLLIETYRSPELLYHVTALGWSEWLRPNSRKIFLEFTDDDAFTTSAGQFLEDLTALAPDHFGAGPSSPAFAFHSVVGIVPREPAGTAYLPEEPLVLDRCRQDENLAPSSGRTYQTLSRLTGGLRYPLCALDDYGAIFESIARDGIRRSGLSCSFRLPVPPAGKRLDTERIELVQAGGDDGPAALARVQSLAECQARAFYIEDERIELCPELCDALGDLPSSTISAEFDCNVFVDVR
jgi:hypothetical protein